MIVYVILKNDGFGRIEVQHKGFASELAARMYCKGKNDPAGKTGPYYEFIPIRIED